MNSSQRNTRYTGVIIGAGFCAAMLSRHLLANCAAAKAGEWLWLASPSLPPALGAAYATTQREHLLNVPACRMGAEAHDIEGFWHWLHTDDGAYAAADWGLQAPLQSHAFLPRGLYGRYLQALSSDTIAHGMYRAAHITEIYADAEGYRLISDCGAAPIHTSQLVLALGNRFVPALAHHSYSLAPGACDFSALSQNSSHPERPFIIIGSGLSAVDTLLSLMRADCRRQIIVISRHAKLPAAHAQPPLATPPPFEIPVYSPLTARLLVQYIRRHTKNYSSQGGMWQHALDSVRPHTIALWQMLSLNDQQRILRHMLPHWNRLRHRMAYEIGEELGHAQHTGRFQFLRGSVVSIAAHAVTLSDGHTLQAQHVFDCRGPRYAPQAHPCLRTLLADKILIPHGTGMGLASADGTYRVNQSHKPIYAVGSLLAGERLESTAVPELRMQIADLLAVLC